MAFPPQTPPASTASVKPSGPKEISYPSPPNAVNNNLPAISYSPPRDPVPVQNPPFAANANGTPPTPAYFPPPAVYPPHYYYYPIQSYYPPVYAYGYGYPNTYNSPPVYGYPNPYNYYAAPYYYPSQPMQSQNHSGDPRNSYYRYPPPNNPGPGYWQTGYRPY